jgi:putative transposase
MPWKETCIVSERHHLISLVVREGLPISEASRSLGISRKTAYKWLSRYSEGGSPELSDRSRARLTQSHRVPPWIGDRLIELRRRTGEGPRKLLARLGRSDPGLALPSASTVGDLLRRAGLVASRGGRRRDPDLRGPSGPYRPGDHANDQWTVDFKGQFRLGDGSLCYPMTIQDDATRFVVCVDGHGSPSTKGALRSFRRAFQSYGVPLRIHSDNGSPFAGSGIGRLSRVSVEWMRQGIEVCRSRPGCPQDNPRHERMHRTLKSFAARPPCRSPSAQQRRFRAFTVWMNEDRPHEALGLQTPSSLYVPSPREWTSCPREPEYPGHWEVRRIRPDGQMKLRGEQLFVSMALGGELVGLSEVQDGIWRLCYRRSVLCFVDVRGKVPRILSDAPDPDGPEGGLFAG